MLFNVGFYGLSAQVEYTQSELATNAERVLDRHCREFMMVQELFWIVLSEGELFEEESLEFQLGWWKRVKKFANRRFRVLLGKAEARESARLNSTSATPLGCICYVTPNRSVTKAVSYTHLTLPTTPYV